MDSFGRNRYYIILIALGIITIVYLVVLFNIQILNKGYKTKADQNALRYKTIHPARGLIYDRNDTLLVYNDAAYDLMVVPAELRTFDTAALCKVLDLTKEQVEQYRMLDELYRDWNSKINVISRKDIDNLYERHVLHSLGIAQVVNFRAGTRIMDLGTGGGFPGIPLAIMFPDVQFHLLDSVGKKIRVCREIAVALGLQNVTTQWARAEEVKERFHFVVSRAVMPLADLVKIVRKNISAEQFNALPNGLLCLKGGELEHEVMPMKRSTMITPLSDYFSEEYFQTKKVVYTQI